MAVEKKVMGPPAPMVKVPKLLRYGGLTPREYKKARGYSVGEISAVGLTIKEARLLGIYVDERRKTTYDFNINALREWLDKVKRGEVIPPRPTLPKRIVVKLDRGRVFKGKTMAGRRARGLLSVKLRQTHNYKWKRKIKERKLKKRHEAKRHKGGH